MRIKIIAIVAIVAVLIFAIQANRGKSDSEKVKVDYQKCLSQIHTFTEEQLFNRYVKRPAKIIDYGDGRKYMLPDECKDFQKAGKANGNRCMIYEMFEETEKSCLRGSSKKCNEAIPLAGRIQANQFHLQKKACELGNENWCYFVALREFSNRTRSSLQRSCERGRDDACIYLGIMLWNSGRAEATALFQKLTQKGEVSGVLERLGAIDEQLSWLRLSCEQGHQGSCFNLRERNREQRLRDFVSNGCYLAAYEE